MHRRSKHIPLIEIVVILYLLAVFLTTILFYESYLFQVEKKLCKRVMAKKW